MVKLHHFPKRYVEFQMVLFPYPRKQPFTCSSPTFPDVGNSFRRFDVWRNTSVPKRHHGGSWEWAGSLERGTLDATWCRPW